MSASFELMDLDAGNLVGSYRSLDEAYAIVRRAIAEHDGAEVNDLGLFRVEGDLQELVAEGADLARRAEERRAA